MHVCYISTSMYVHTYIHMYIYDTVEVFQIFNTVALLLFQFKFKKYYNCTRRPLIAFTHKLVKTCKFIHICIHIYV